jgi:glutathione-regulated potassium-efflux system ancillary protein KefC/glutathione-regulated potassium-efflux system protein KefB
VTSLLTQVAVFLAATVIAVPLFRRFRLSAVLAYLASGMLIGPWGLRLVADVVSILHFAEFGVVLLLFVIGLELQPSRLLALRRVVFGLGAAQVLVTTVVLAALGLLLGLPLPAALIAGFGLSLSSTPMVLQLLGERHELKSQHGRAAFGVLLFQDLAVLPALAVLPVLGVAAVAGDNVTRLNPLLGLGAVALIVVAGRYALRPILRIVANTGIPDVFTAAALLLVIATALLVNAAGLSMALGAFIAGVLLADSEYRHELEADLQPFKGLLLGLFFIAVGMTVNLGLVVAVPGQVIALTAGLMVAKGLVLYALGRFASRPLQSQAKSLALVMLAGGEFAFVLFPVAVDAGLIGRDLGELLVIAVTLSMLLSPLLLIADDRWFSRWAGGWLGPAVAAEYDEVVPDDHRVVIAGFGRFGQIVARILRARGIPFTALDANQTQVDFVRRFGNRIFYGDAARPEMLRAAQLDKAEVLVIAVDDQDASVKIAEFARHQYPNLKVFARVRNRQHAFRLMELDVPYVMRETYLSSLDMAERVLEWLGDERAAAQRSVALFRAHDEATLQEQYEIRGDDDKFLATTKASAAQLETLFEADRRDDQSR